MRSYPQSGQGYPIAGLEPAAPFTYAPWPVIPAPPPANSGALALAITALAVAGFALLIAVASLTFSGDPDTEGPATPRTGCPAG